MDKAKVIELLHKELNKECIKLKHDFELYFEERKEFNKTIWTTLDKKQKNKVRREERATKDSFKRKMVILAGINSFIDNNIEKVLKEAMDTEN